MNKKKKNCSSLGECGGLLLALKGGRKHWILLGPFAMLLFQFWPVLPVSLSLSFFLTRLLKIYMPCD